MQIPIRMHVAYGVWELGIKMGNSDILGCGTTLIFDLRVVHSLSII